MDSLHAPAPMWGMVRRKRRMIVIVIAITRVLRSSLELLIWQYRNHGHIHNII